MGQTAGPPADRKQPFGHIHASSGMETRGPTTLVNASVVVRTYRVGRPAVVLDLPE